MKRYWILGLVAFVLVVALLALDICIRLNNPSIVSSHHDDLEQRKNSPQSSGGLDGVIAAPTVNNSPKDNRLFISPDIIPDIEAAQKEKAPIVVLHADPSTHIPSFRNTPDPSRSRLKVILTRYDVQQYMSSSYTWQQFMEFCATLTVVAMANSLDLCRRNNRYPMVGLYVNGRAVLVDQDLWDQIEPNLKETFATYFISIQLGRILANYNDTKYFYSNKTGFALGGYDPRIGFFYYKKLEGN